MTSEESHYKRYAKVGSKWNIQWNADVRNEYPNLDLLRYIQSSSKLDFECSNRVCLSLNNNNYWTIQIKMPKGSLENKGNGKWNPIWSRSEIWMPKFLNSCLYRHEHQPYNRYIKPRFYFRSYLIQDCLKAIQKKWYRIHRICKNWVIILTDIRVEHILTGTISIKKKL
jgi:hypothetical protein